MLLAYRRTLSLTLVVILSVAFGATAQETGTAVLVGSVVDSARKPVLSAEIALPALSLHTTTVGDSGRFMLPAIPAGRHEIIIRHVGYSPEVRHIEFATYDTIEAEIVLRGIQRLESVAVQASNVVPSFEEHRNLGLGSFITREDLAKMEGRKLSEIIAQIRGIRLFHGLNARTYVYSNRRPVSSMHSRLMGDGSEGAPRDACYAQVYLDESVVYRSSEDEPLFDINAFPPSSIEAIEYYAGPATTPPKYSRLNSQCGVLVIHTRRSP